MSEIPVDLKYTETHEWIREEADGSVVVGITDHAQSLLGELVYVELPEVGSNVAAGDESGVVESVKAASDVYSPIAGEVTAINSELEENPNYVNSSPYHDGWLFKIKPQSKDELNKLLSADDYNNQVAAETH